MRFLILLCCLTCLNACLQATEISIDLSKDAPGKTPAGFLSLGSGPGKPADWKIAMQEVPPLLASLTGKPGPTASRSVLAVQSLDADPSHSPILLYTNVLFADFTLTTRFKIEAGMAGVVYRATDQSNYYVVRASTEGNLLWYRVVAGHTYEGSGIGVKIPIPKNTWMELRIECAGNQTRCFLNDKLAIPPARPGSPTNGLAINDTTFATGSLGLWCGANTRCCFVDTRIDYSQRAPFAQSVIEAVKKEYPRLLGLELYADKTPGSPVIVGDADPSELGKPGDQYDENVIQNGQTYFLKTSHWVEVTMPLRDRNGDVAAAMKTRMETFPGETQENAVVRAMTVRKAIEKRMSAFEDIGH